MIKMTKEEKQTYKNKLLEELTRHVGPSRKIGMGKLYERVFEKPWANRINDTRMLRTMIKELRKQGVPIGSSRSKFGGGYWLISTASELDDYCTKLTNEAVKKLDQVAKLRKTTLPALMGQMALNLKPHKEAA